MPDDVSPDWVLRSLEAHERRTEREHTAMETRLTELARDTVPLQRYMDREQDRVDDMTALTSRVAKLEERPAMTLTRWLGVLTVAAAFLAIGLQAYGTLKGAR